MDERRCAVILDRDGVLNVDSGYVHEADEIEWIPGAMEALRRCNEEGFLVLVITNQSGVGRGLYDEDAVHRLHGWMEEQAGKSGGRIHGFYFCPHLPDAGCSCRKPNPGLFLKAVEDWRLDLAHSFSIGDRAGDIAASRAAGIAGYRFPGGNLDEFMRPLLEVRRTRKPSRGKRKPDQT